MADFDIHFENNSDEVRKELRRKISRILTAWGMEAVRRVQQLTPVGKLYGGNLRQSINFQEDESAQEVQIGSPADYAAYVEMGTGKYTPGGRPTPWSYQAADGKWYKTSGMPAQPYLKPGVESGVTEYERKMRQILEED